MCFVNNKRVIVLYSNLPYLIFNEFYHSRLMSFCKFIESIGYLSGKKGRANFNFIAQAEEFHANCIIHANEILYKGGLLTGEVGQANFDTIVQLNETSSFCLALNVLGMINGQLIGATGQANFTALIEHTPILFGSRETSNLWSRVPRLTIVQWEAILTLCRDHADRIEEGQRAFINYVNRFILEIGAGGRSLLADRQSTHTASVHRSASESAMRLKNRYGNQIAETKLDETIKVLMTEINTYSSSIDKKTTEQLSAAKRCLERLNKRSSGILEFNDPTSKTTTKELLALVWIAIHDEEMRYSTVTKEDGIAALIKGLYEIQSGYNLSATDEDDGAADYSICSSGTFNILVESLVSIHTDVEIRLINRRVAEFRLQTVVKEHLMAYFKNLPEPVSQAERTERAADIVSLSKGMESKTWDAIKPAVLDLMFTEFGALFDSRHDHTGFIEMIEMGAYVCINETELQTAGILMRSDTSSTRSPSHAFFQSSDSNDTENAAAATGEPHILPRPVA